MIPTQIQALWMYEKMVAARYYEELLAAAYLEGKQPMFNMANGPIPGEMHLSNGQEPCAVGFCVHLKSDDVVMATHRSHHIAIAKGVDLKAMTAEIMGKQSGLSGGRGGHMHLFDARANFYNSGIIAAGVGPAVGAALARKMRGESGISVAFIGEGAVNQGAFHEALNLASLWNLPFVCIIEDNGYGISIRKEEATAVSRNDIRAAAYGMPGLYVEGNDPYAIFAAAGEAIARARNGDGPSLIEIETFRLAGHFLGDPEFYRPPGEKEALMARDPVPAMRIKLLESGVAETTLQHIEQVAREDVDEAFRFARGEPDAPAEDAVQKIFA